MKILQVIDRLNVGGGERVLVDLANILFAKGHTVHVLTLVCPGPLAQQLNEGINLINLKRRMKYSLGKLKQVNDICGEYDIVHAHLRYNFRYIALAKMLYGGRYHLVLHDHFGDIENDRSIPIGIKFFARRNKWFIGVSRSLADWAVHNLRLREENVLLLPNIVVKRTSSGEQTKVTHDSTIRVLHVSNFRESKHHIFAIRLIAALRRHVPVRVLFVGQVINPEFFRNINAAIDANGIRDIVTVLHDCDDVQKLMGDFDLGLHTAYQESGPLVLIEYLAQGVPFLAYRTGEVSAQISPVFPEFFMVDFEVDNWINRIRDILTRKPTYIGKMVDVFEQLYSSDGYYKKCIEFYRRILNARA